MLSTPALWYLAAGYVALLAFFVAQRPLRRTNEARSLRGGDLDRGSTRLIAAAFGIGLLLPLVLDSFGAAVFALTVPEVLAALGVMLLGLFVRLWAALHLGWFYTSTLLVTEGQTVVDSGPYSRVRHPGYLGTILLWTGFGVLTSNLALAVLFPAMFVAVYLRRISVEEKMLAEQLGPDYARYQERTKRLIPYVF